MIRPNMEFNGKFPPGCQEISVPASLKALVAMLLNGCNVAKPRNYAISAMSYNCAVDITGNY